MHLGLPEIVGSLGVAVLLTAFFLSLLGRIAPQGFVYLSMNALGAALACLSSWLIGFMPFVVLEGAWALVALATLAARLTGPSSPSN